MLKRMIVAGGLVMGMVDGCESMGLGGKKDHDNQPSSQRKNDEDVTMVGATFFRAAAIGDMAEIQTSQVALNKAQDPEVRSYAQHMVADHQKNSQELQRLAQTKNITLPTQLDEKHANEVAKLQKMEAGNDFDRAYITGQRKAQQESITNYTAAARNAKNEDVRAFADSALITLRDHLTMVEKIEKNLK